MKVIEQESKVECDWNQIPCGSCGSLKLRILYAVDQGLFVLCEDCGIISFLPLNIKYTEIKQTQQKPNPKYAG